MNVLGLVFSLILILSYGFYACWEKQMAQARLRSTYVRHEKANRKILNSYQSKVYEQFRSKPTPSEEGKNETEIATKEEAKEPELNRECSKINLWPLIQEGRENQQPLYELTAKMIRTFYGHLSKKKRFEYHFLDAFLSAAKSANQTPFSLEKVAFHDPELQKIYYKMLKGTKKWDLASGLGYPPLLDYAKADPTPNKLCLFHAHPDLIAAVFNQPIATRIHTEIHQKNGPLLTREFIERICTEMHLIAVEPELFEMLELGKPIHQEYKKTLIAEESDLSLRKTVYFKG